MQTDIWWFAGPSHVFHRPRENKLFSHFILFQSLSLSNQADFKICSQLSIIQCGNHMALKSLSTSQKSNSPFVQQEEKQGSSKGHNTGYEGKNQQTKKVSEGEEQKMALRGFLKFQESPSLLGNLWVEQISKELRC